MKIAVFTDSYTPYVSGVVRSIQRFNVGLSRLGHRVYVFAPSYGKTYPDDQRDATGARVFRFYSITAPTNRQFSLPIPISPGADRVLAALDIDVIHSHSPFLMGQLSSVLARQTGIPLVFTHHTMYHEYVHYIPAPRTITQQMVVSYLQRYARNCDFVIAPTPKVKTMIESLYELTTPTASIPTGIDLEPYQQADTAFLAKRLQLPPGTQFLLFVGRLGKEKNPQLVLNTFALLKDDFPGLHLVFVGDGPERDILQRETTQMQLESRIHFTGVLKSEQVVHAYASAKAFVFGSTTETQGLVTIEAMAAGTPVVVVRATGSEDLVNDGVDGFLTAASAEALAGSLRKLLTDDGLYRSMAAAAKQTAQQYSLDNTAAQLAAVYEHLAAKPRHPRRFPRILYR